MYNSNCQSILSKKISIEKHSFSLSLSFVSIFVNSSLHVEQAFSYACSCAHKMNMVENTMVFGRGRKARSRTRLSEDAEPPEPNAQTVCPVFEVEFIEPWVARDRSCVWATERVARSQTTIDL